MAETKFPAAQHIMSLQAEVRAIKETDRGDTIRVVEGTASTQARDRYKTRLSAAALERAIPGYMRNPVYCFNHDWSLPIGTVEHAERRGDTIFTRAVLMDKDAGDALTDAVWARIERGVIKAQSIGWNGDWKTEGEVDKDGTFWWGKRDGSGTLDWVDTSAVTVPGNSEADDLRVARSLGLDDSQPWLDTIEPDVSLLGGLTLDAVPADAGEEVWRTVASAMCRVANAQDVDTEPALAILRECYNRLEKQWPDGIETRSITWHNDEPRIYEEGIFAASFSKAKGLIEGNRNIMRAWQKVGRVLSPVYAAEVSAVAMQTHELAAEISAIQDNVSPANTGGVKSATSLKEALIEKHNSKPNAIKDRLMEKAVKETNDNV